MDELSISADLSLSYQEMEFMIELEVSAPLPEGLVDLALLEFPELEELWLELPEIEAHWLELPELDQEWLQVLEEQPELEMAPTLTVEELTFDEPGF
jgi:hypothetical protein